MLTNSITIHVYMTLTFRWMNKLGLAAIVYDTSKDDTPMASFKRPSEQNLRQGKIDN